MREKLIELLTNSATCLSMGIESCDTCPYGRVEDCYTHALADHLIANGVTVPIHCKQCKHWADDDQVKYCKIGFYMVGENGYCVYGERKN